MSEFPCFKLAFLSGVTGYYLPGFVQLTNVDIAISHLALFSNYTLDQCKTACANTTNCAAFSISCSDGDLCGVKRNGVDPTYQCALKGALGASSIVVNTNAVVLVNLNGQFVLATGYDFYGNDIFQISDTILNCLKTCLNTPGCAVILYTGWATITSSSIYTCYLKTINNIDWTFGDGWQTYLIPKTVSSGSSLMTHCFPRICFPGNTAN